MLVYNAEKNIETKVVYLLKTYYHTQFQDPYVVPVSFLIEKFVCSSHCY